jgi:hypothetical protein
MSVASRPWQPWRTRVVDSDPTASPPQQQVAIQEQAAVRHAVGIQPASVERMTKRSRTVTVPPRERLLMPPDHRHNDAAQLSSSLVSALPIEHIGKIHRSWGLGNVVQWHMACAGMQANLTADIAGWPGLGRSWVRPYQPPRAWTRCVSTSAYALAGAPLPVPLPVLVALPLAQTGEGISECELIQWFVKVSGALRHWLLPWTLWGGVCAICACPWVGLARTVSV